MIFISIGAIPNESNSTNLSSRACVGAGGLKMRDGQEITSLNDLEIGSIYIFPSLSKITEGCPELSEKGLMATVITLSYNDKSKHQILISGIHIATREFYADTWRIWFFKQ